MDNIFTLEQSAPADRITRVARLRTIDQFRAHEQRDDQQPRYDIVQFGMK